MSSSFVGRRPRSPPGRSIPAARSVLRCFARQALPTPFSRTSPSISSTTTPFLRAISRPPSARTRWMRWRPRMGRAEPEVARTPPGRPRGPSFSEERGATRRVAILRLHPSVVSCIGASCRERADSLAEVVAPALREHVELSRASHALDVVAVAGVKPRDLVDAEAVQIAAQVDYGIAGFDMALAGDGEVEAVESALEELGHELIAPHFDTELEAR